MKKILKNSRKYLLVIALLSLYTTLYAQSGVNVKISPDTSGQKIAKLLAVSPEKGKQIHAAFNYRRAEIMRLMRSNTLPLAEKQKQLKKILDERRHKIDSALTKSQKNLLMQSQGNLQKRETDRIEALKQKHEAEMNQVQHKRTVKVATNK